MKKNRLISMLAAVLLSISVSAQEDFALANFDHEVTQPHSSRATVIWTMPCSTTTNAARG